ncbi:MAG: putative hydrolase [Candidatus Hydrogenedentota bacterium]
MRWHWAILCAVLFSCNAAAHTITVALLQMLPDRDNVPANLDKAEAWCRDAAAKGADIALMPEMWSIGYTRFDPEKPNAREEFYKLALATSSPQIQRFAKLAKELNMAIAVTYLQAYEPLPRNAVTVFDRHGKEVFTYAKVHTSDFKPMEASMTPGDRFCTGKLDTKAGPVQVGAMICFDREQPESARTLMLQGAEVVLTPNACGLEELRLDQFKIRAWENCMVVAMTNYPSPQNNGHSVAFDQSGACLVSAGEEEGLFLAVIDLDSLRARREKTIHGNAYRRPHRYDILTSPEKAPVWQRTDGNGKPYDSAIR